MKDLLPLLFSSGVIVALIEFIKFVFGKIFDRVAKKKDKKDEKSDEVDETLATLKEALKQTIKSNIRQLCRKYIEDGAIDYDERSDLLDLHDIYHKLGGNGHLDADMKTVNNLPVHNSKK